MIIRLLFAVLVVVHGLIHFIGFSRAFNYEQNNLVSKPISRPYGLLWLLTTALFVLCGAFVVLKNDWWYVGAVSIALSQVLILTTWKESKWGSATNTVILFLVAINFAGWRFQHASDIQARHLLENSPRTDKLVSLTDIQMQPPIVRKWLIRAGILNTKYASTARIRQRGLLRTKQDGKWMPMVAVQYFTTSKPSFLWVAKINTGIVPIAGKDQYIDGKGSMVVKIASMVPIADAQGAKIDQGSLLRFLAEIQWFPSAALCDYIKWEQLDDHTANATMSYKGTNAIGTFSFNNMGDIIAFEANRYMNVNGVYSLEKWYVPVKEYRVFEGIRIPSKGKAIWKLKTGDFNWFEWEITEVNYNVYQSF